MNNTELQNNDEKQQVFAKRNFYTNDDSGKVFIFSMLLPIILSFVVTFIISFIVRSTVGEDANLASMPWVSVISAFIGPISFLSIFFLYNKMFGISIKASTIANKPTWHNYLIINAVSLVALFGLIMFTNCQDYVLSLLGFNIDGSLPLPMDNFGWLILNILLLAVLPAICEELVFRGIVMQGFRKNFSDFTAIILSACMFALMHCNVQQLIYPFMLGIILGWICMRTGSLWASILVHFLNNAIVVVMAYFKWDIVFGFINAWWYYLVAILLVFVVMLIMFLIDKFYFKQKNQHEIEKEKVTRMSPFVWVGLAISIVLMILSLIINILGK